MKFNQYYFKFFRPSFSIKWVGGVPFMLSFQMCWGYTVVHEKMICIPFPTSFHLDLNHANGFTFFFLNKMHFDYSAYIDVEGSLEPRPASRF